MDKTADVSMPGSPVDEEPVKEEDLTPELYDSRAPADLLTLLPEEPAQQPEG